MAEVNVKPELRFSQFTKDWKLEKFGKFVANSAFGPRFSSSLYSVDGNVATLRTTDMDIDGNINYESMPKANLNLADFDEHILASNDLIISRSGTIGITGIFQRQSYPTLPGAFLIRFRLIIDFINPTFVKYLFNSAIGRNKLESLSAGGVQKNLTGTSVKSAEFFFPQIEEQLKIASFLTAVDERIQLLQKKKNHLEEYKKGVMQKLFSQEIRFKDENGNDFPDWEDKKLGKICNKQSSNISTNTLAESEGDYKVYGATGFLQYVDFYREEHAYISIVKDGAGVGRILLCDPKSSVLGTLDILKPKEDNNIEFLYALISNIRFEKYITGSTIPHIYFKDYSKEKIKVPIATEQKKIAAFLNSLDKAIESVATEIEGTEEYKKGLLQKMFV